MNVCESNPSNYAVFLPGQEESKKRRVSFAVNGDDQKKQEMRFADRIVTNESGSVQLKKIRSVSFREVEPQILEPLSDAEISTSIAIVVAGVQKILDKYGLGDSKPCDVVAAKLYEFSYDSTTIQTIYNTHANNPVKAELLNIQEEKDDKVIEVIASHLSAITDRPYETLKQELEDWLASLINDLENSVIRSLFLP
ncbi:MAG: hypothetical protein K2Y01_11360 [Rhabdochlamydiaceae bacterium]|nr:hypothetical protein [Rhabdochlamydiaceae bacterium]